MWIVQLEIDCWVAPWSGDPGRTLVRESAKPYRSEHAAKCALSRAKRVFPNRDYSRAVVVPNAVLSGKPPHTELGAAKQTSMDISVFPEVCPWDFEQLVDDGFFPD